MATRFRSNPAASVQLALDPEVRLNVQRKAEQVKALVIGGAPIGDTEDFVHSIFVAPKDDGYVVYSNDFAAHLIEFGSVRNPAYAPFRRAVMAAGLRYVDRQ